jgi:hypothetical protein
MDRQNNEDIKQDTKAVNWWTDKTMRYPVWYLVVMLAIVLSVHQLTALVSCLVSCSYVGHCFIGPSIDSFGVLFDIFIVLSVHQLPTWVSCLISLLFCRSINWQLWYPVWYLYCFVDSSIDSFGILFGIFIVLSVINWQLLVSCLVSSLFVGPSIDSFWCPVWYLHCFVGPSIVSFGILFGIFIVLSVHQTKVVNWWTTKQ